MAGDIESLKEMLAFNRAQKPADEEDIENDECPYDAWSLKINARGEKACPICGRIFR